MSKPQKSTLGSLNGQWLVIGVILATLISGYAEIYAQDQVSPPPAPSMPYHLSIHVKLYEAMQELAPTEAVAPSDEQIRRFAARGIRLREDGKVLVEIIGPEGEDIFDWLDFDNLHRIGVETGADAAEITVEENADIKVVQTPLTVFGNRAEAWIPISRIHQTAALLPAGYFIKPVGRLNYDEVIGQGPAVTNSDSYGNAGHNGAGLTIAVIDGSFTNLTAARNNGDAPAVYTAINYTPDVFESGGTHGTGCVEAAFDHVPGATWRIYKIDSLADVATAVNNAIASGVDVISHSISWYNEGWADNTGTACAAANNASNNGIIFFTSSGNRADSHYQGNFTDADNDGWHEFGPGDETIDISISSLQNGDYYLSWSNSSKDLDFYLYNPARTAVVASSTNSGNGIFEEFFFDHSNPTADYHLAVYHRSGSESTQIEIFSHNAGVWQEHIVAAGSSTSPSNATGSRVISIGAVTHGSQRQQRDCLLQQPRSQ